MGKKWKQTRRKGEMEKKRKEGQKCAIFTVFNDSK